MTAQAAIPRDGKEDTPPDEHQCGQDSVARLFVDSYGHCLRYVAESGKWMLFNGKVWAPEKTLLAYDLIRELSIERADRSSKGGASRRSAAFVSGVEQLARADRAIVATIDQWDTDPMVLNTPDGVIDLKLSASLPHDPERYMCKITAASRAIINTQCPRWRALLDRVTGSDPELQGYLARVAGYCLTGLTKEHALFFIYGTGGNGKGTFLNTIKDILGNYAVSAPIETFTATKYEQHPTGIARLAGARLVISTETEEGRAWAESRIKELTGGDTICARYIARDFFEFKPQFKLIISGNHMPALHNVDEGIRRRFNMIPFTVTIPREERDPDLLEKLKAEWPAILRWMLDGLRDYLKQGLNPPRVVRDATLEYFEGEDVMGTWIRERCWIGKDYGDTASTLFGDYKRWCEGAGECPGNQKQFAKNLKARGFSSQHTRTGSRWTGIAVVHRMDGDG